MTRARSFVAPLAGGHAALGLGMAARPAASPAGRLLSLLDAAPAVMVFVGIQRDTPIRIPLALGTLADGIRAGAWWRRSKPLAIGSIAAAIGGAILVPQVD